MSMSSSAVERLSPQQIQACLAEAPVASLPLGTLEFLGHPLAQASNSR